MGNGVETDVGIVVSKPLPPPTSTAALSIKEKIF